MLSDLGGRIRQAIENKFLNMRAFSEETGMPYPSLRNYVSGTKKPGTDALALISAATGYSIDWLVTGKERERDPGKFATPDIVMLQQIIEGVEKYLDQRRRKLKPEKKAKLIAILYEHFYGEGEVDPDYVNSVVSVAA